MTIRLLKEEDFPQLLALWTATPGMGLNSADDSPEGIRQYLRRNPDTCFAAEAEGRIVGAILAGHDGRRGFLFTTWPWGNLSAFRGSGELSSAAP